MTLEPRSHWPVSILSGLAALVNMSLPLVLVRILSPEEIGNYKIFFLYLSIAPGLSMISGVASGLAYWGGRAEARTALQTSSMIILLSAVIFTLAGFVFVQPLTSFMHWPVNYSYLFAIGLFGAIAGAYVEEAAIAKGYTWSGAFIYSGAELLRTIIIVAVALIYADILSVFLAHVLCTAVKVFASYLYGIKIKVVGLDINKDTSKAVLQYALPVSLAWVFGVFVDRADQLILATFISAKEFAFYSIGCLVVPPLFTIEHSITRVLVPQLSEAFSTNDYSRAARLHRHAVENIAFLIIPVVAVLIVFSEPIITLLFTDAFQSASKFLTLFALSYLALIFPNDVVPRAKGNSSWILRNFAFFSIFSLLLAYFLSKDLGALGALSAILISKACVRIYAIYYVKKVTGWCLKEFLPLSSLSRYLGITLILMLLILSTKTFYPSTILWFIVSAPIFGIGYLLLVAFLDNFAAAPTTQRKRVLLLAQSLPIGGLEKMLLNLAVEINKDNSWQPIVVAYDQDVMLLDKSLIPTLRTAGIPVILWQKNAGFSLYTVLRLVILTIKYRISVIHSHNIGPLIYAAFAKMLLLGRIKLVHTQHSLLHLTEKSRYSVYEPIFSRAVNSLVLVSDQMLPIYKKWRINPKKVEVILNGVPLSDNKAITAEDKLKKKELLLKDLPEGIQDKLSKHINKDWLLYLARIHPIKGQLHALKLWQVLSDQLQANSMLIFVGPESFEGEQIKLQSVVEKLSNHNNIVFVGSTTNTKLWYESSNLFLSLSDFEGLPLAPLEALSVGTPVFLSEIPGHLLFADVGILCKNTEYNLMALKLENALKQLKEELPTLNSEQRIAWVKAYYSLSEMASKYQRLYDTTVTH